MHDDERRMPAGGVRLPAVPGTPVPFEAVVADGRNDGAALVVAVHGLDAATGTWTLMQRPLPARSHDAYLDLHSALAARFGTRVPGNRAPAAPHAFQAPYEPLLTESIEPRVLHGYGDPAVLRVETGGDGVWWYLVATSNDAPDAFPIARSRDLHDWRFVGFVFPRGRTPAWAADGAGTSDFWAPEMHRVGGEYRVYFTAREREGRDLAIGVATAPRPDGPFTTPDAPLLRGGVIDPHVLVDGDGTAYLFWKEDSNGVWPGLLHALLHDRPRLITALLDDDADRATASLLATLWPWARGLEPMERFFVQQPLVEAVTQRFTAVQARLHALLAREPDAALRAAVRAVLAAMRTRILAQRLAPDGRSLVGARTLVLENDREWEAHLVEGVWVARHAGRHYLFYAGNDFSTARYGIGVAIADAPLGPYVKLDGPLLRSTPEWWGPGHPSVADGPDGRPRLFFHAFFPGRMGYGEFRALLTVPLAFEPGRVTIG